MSVNRAVYLITGVDIKDVITDKWGEWIWTNEAENFINNITKGEIKIIEDGMSGLYTYIGYVHTVIEEYDDVIEVLSTDKQEQDDIKVAIWEEINDLYKQGLIHEEGINKLACTPCKQILFTHYW